MNQPSQQNVINGRSMPRTRVWRLRDHRWAQEMFEGITKHDFGEYGSCRLLQAPAVVAASLQNLWGGGENSKDRRCERGQNSCESGTLRPYIMLGTPKSAGQEPLLKCTEGEAVPLRCCFPPRSGHVHGLGSFVDEPRRGNVELYSWYQRLEVRFHCVTFQTPSFLHPWGKLTVTSHGKLA